MPDDYRDNTKTTGHVVVGGSTTGEIDFEGDRDWFEVTLVAGKTYQFDLEGVSTGAGTLISPYLHGIYETDDNLFEGTTNNGGGSGLNSRVTFTATASTVYYVSAGTVLDREGTYTLSVTDVTDGVPDDFTAGTGTTGTVAVGGSATGDIESGEDLDWFEVTLQANRIYRFDLKGSSTGAGTLSDPYLRGIYDADGSAINRTTDDDSGGNGNSQVTFTATASAKYYVSAGARGDEEGTYTLSVTDVTDGVLDDFTAGTGTTGTVTVAGTATGDIESNGDRDWFAVTLQADRTYRFDLRGSETGAGSLGDPYLRGIYDAGGSAINGTTDNDGGTGNNSRVTFTATANATYYVSAGASGDGEGTYTLSVTDITDDFTAGTGTTGAVAVGDSAAGEIESGGDRDWFAVTLDAGKTYRFDLEGYWTGNGTLWDPYLYGIYDADGSAINGTTDDDGGAGNNSRVTFTATENAKYYVSAGAYQGKYGAYTLSVTEITDDFTAGIGTTGAVTVGSSATGDIESKGNHDWFVVTLDAGRTYRFDLEGSRTNSGTLSDPYLRGIYDANGNRIDRTTDDDGGIGWNSRVTFTATEDATYYVSAGAFGEGLGTYSLSVTDLMGGVPDDFTAGTGTTGTVAVGGSTMGAIESKGDRDWFAVTLEADNIYRFDLEGFDSRDGTLIDPYLRGIHDAGGTLIDRTANDDGGFGLNSRFTFVATESGTYYVSAGAYGDREGAYTLSVTDITDDVSDDFGASTRTTGAVVVGGSVTGNLEFPGDRDWFAVTLDAGKTYQFDLEGFDTGAGTLYDPYLVGIYDAGGTLIDNTTDDDGGDSFNSRVRFAATNNATYYVSAGSFDYQDDKVGTYTLSVEEVM